MQVIIPMTVYFLEMRQRKKKKYIEQLTNLRRLGGKITHKLYYCIRCFLLFCPFPFLLMANIFENINLIFS